RNIAGNPRVALHLEGNGRGGDIIVVTGEAAVSEAEPSADQVPAYVEKYAEPIERNGWAPASFAEDYSVPIRVRFGSLRGHCPLAAVARPQQSGALRGDSAVDTGAEGDGSAEVVDLLLHFDEAAGDELRHLCADLGESCDLAREVGGLRAQAGGLGLRA